MSTDAPLFKVGDIIEIPRDQHGNPVLEIDPTTRKVAEPRRLAKFRVKSIDPYGEIKLEPV